MVCKSPDDPCKQYEQGVQSIMRISQVDKLRLVQSHQQPYMSIWRFRIEIVVYYDFFIMI